MIVKHFACACVSEDSAGVAIERPDADDRIAAGDVFEDFSRNYQLIRRDLVNGEQQRLRLCHHAG